MPRGSISIWEGKISVFYMNSSIFFPLKVNHSRLLICAVPACKNSLLKPVTTSGAQENTASKQVFSICDLSTLVILFY